MSPALLVQVRRFIVKGGWRNKISSLHCWFLDSMICLGDFLTGVNVIDGVNLRAICPHSNSPARWGVLMSSRNFFQHVCFWAALLDNWSIFSQRFAEHFQIIWTFIRSCKRLSYHPDTFQIIQTPVTSWGRFQIIWTLIRLYGRLSDHLETYQIIWTLLISSWDLSDHLDTFQINWIVKALSYHPENFRSSVHFSNHPDTFWFIRTPFTSSGHFQIIWALFRSYGHLSDHPDTFQIIRTPFRVSVSSRQFSYMIYHPDNFRSSQHFSNHPDIFQIVRIVKVLFISSRQFQIIWPLFKSFINFKYHPNT